MYRLEKTEKRDYNGKPTDFRIWRNNVTGNELVTYFLRQDKFGHTWWTFEDLFQFPFPRQVASKKIVDLYGHGLGLDDIKSITGQLKAILKGAETDKYEKAFAKVLELESLTETVADPIRQHLGLCTVYILMDDENPEIFSNRESSLKMTVLSEDPEGMSFFLSWWIDRMSASGKDLKAFSQIALLASQLEKMEVPLN